MPDSVAAYASRGSTYVVTANEGDARDYDGYGDEARVSSLTLSPEAFGGAAGVAALRAPAALGRLTVSTTSPRDAQGRVTELHVFGARSFSIRDAEGRLVFDSGDQLEQVVAARLPEGVQRRQRGERLRRQPQRQQGARAGGPRPRAGGGAHLRLRRARARRRRRRLRHHRPRAGRVRRLREHARPLRRPGGERLRLRARGPGVRRRARTRPTGQPLLLVGNEISGTTTVYEVTGR